MKLVHLALRNRAEAASGFPTAREHENVQFTRPSDGSAYSEEDFVPAGARTETLGNGLKLARGLYVIRFYFPANTGVLAMSDAADAVVAQFDPDWSALLADQTRVRMRKDALPYRGQIVNDVAGYARCTITIPWEHWRS